jgi:hypothetical protein
MNSIPKANVIPLTENLASSAPPGTPNTKKTPAMFQKEIKDWSLDKDIADELERKINERRKVLDKEGEIQTKQVLKMLNDK